jgi:osmotically-inducible protein OsmY
MELVGMRNELLMAVTCAALFVSGVAHSDNPGDANPTGDKPGLSENASGAEASLVVTVQQELSSDPELRGERIEVDGNERRLITLRGSVATERQRERAQEIAEGVANVQMVENRLVVRGQPSAEREKESGSMTVQGRQVERDVAPDFPPR